MNRDRGPAKRLAPTLAPDTCCPHEFTGAEGIQLEVDCEACGGAQDLMNRRCLAGVVNIVVRGAAPDTVILKRFIHKRYRKDAVRLVSDVASELSSLMRASASASVSSDRRCRTCSCGPGKLIMEMRRSLLEDPGGYVRDKARVESVLERAANASACEDRWGCLAQARSASVVASGVSR